MQSRTETIDLTGDDDESIPFPFPATSPMMSTSIASPTPTMLNGQRQIHNHISIPVLNMHNPLPSTSSAFSLGPPSRQNSLNMNLMSNGTGNNLRSEHAIIDLTRTPSPQQQHQLYHHSPFHHSRPIMHHRQISIPPAPSTFSGSSNGAITMPHSSLHSHVQPLQHHPIVNNPQRPACIGQLSCTALVLYPIPYLVSSVFSEDSNSNSGSAKDGFTQFNPNGTPSQSSNKDPNADWVVARLKVETPKHADPNNPSFSLPILTPPLRGIHGETLPPEQFGVVEQKVANVLGSMLAKALIKVEGRILRGKPGVPVLPLQLLLFTPHGNVNVLGSHFQSLGVLLNHPTAPFDLGQLTSKGILYVNPHNPPAGGWRGGAGVFGALPLGGAGQHFNGIGMNGTNGPGLATAMDFNSARWQPQALPNAKSIEVQRSQAADAVFASLRSGEELSETIPPDGLIRTPLYPHQKKALTFLLEREGEREGGSRFWKVRGGLGDVGESLGVRGCEKKRRWVNVVTNKEVTEEPKECKGGLLADDMGLGKTITCVSLIASTLDSAKYFAEEPLIPPTPPPPLIPNIEALDLQASHFAGSVWGMPPTNTPPPTSGGSGSQRAQAKQRAQEKAAETIYVRMKRLKVKSRGTLIICPLSTVANWEDQFREHWGGGGVVIIGGGEEGKEGKEKVKKEKEKDWKSSVIKKEKEIVSSNEWKKEESEPSLSTGVSVSPSASWDAKTIPSSPATPNQKPLLSSDGELASKDLPLRIYVYHGNARRPDPDYLADFDAVITTYATLASEFSKQLRSMDAELSSSATGADGEGDADVEVKSKKLCGMKRKKLCGVAAGEENSSPLQMVHWFRVVLDEAHSIKETSTVASRASCDLMADRRLCLTGTPVQNKLDDVYALIKFLRVEPLDDKAVWTEYIGTPVKFGQSLGITRLQTVMKCLTLRRTKESKAEDGKKILELPPRKDELRYLRFDEKEQNIYNQVFQESKAEFNELSDRNEVMKNYVGILQKILRLRQICDHWQLITENDGEITDGKCLERAIQAIEKEGFTVELANVVYNLLKEGGSAQCVACGYDLGSHYDGQAGGDIGTDTLCATPAQKKTKKSKACMGMPTSGTGTRQNSPGPGPRALMTKCQHLYCLPCFDKTSPFIPPPSLVDGAAPACDASTRCCAVCQTSLVPCQDVLEVDLLGAHLRNSVDPAVKKTKREKGQVNPLTYNPSTKIRALLNDLMESSKLNPYSRNFDPEVMMVDSNGNTSDDNITKTIVFSQWTSMLDKIEEGLDLTGIYYERLDGTMKREDRSKAMDELKYNKACEVLLVSLRAGGVGLNLTAAQRVYLMDPYWNPAVENQAVDRIHRLGQTKPVTTIKFIIENTIEAKLLEVQKKKTALANMTLAGTTYSKAELMARRMEELNELFGME